MAGIFTEKPVFACYRPDHRTWEFWAGGGMIAIAPLTEREAQIVGRRIARFLGGRFHGAGEDESSRLA